MGRENAALNNAKDGVRARSHGARLRRKEGDLRCYMGVVKAPLDSLLSGLGSLVVL